MRKCFYKTTICGVILIFYISCSAAHAVDFRRYPALLELADKMVSEDGYPRAQLEAVLGEAAIDRSVIRAMDRQYEALPWYEYRKRFINDERVRKGVAYWNEHEAVLRRAAREYGVPPAVVVALIGVETHFGTHLGGRRVLDSLVTLTAEYPRRSAYFSGELRVFLNTTRAENIAPESVTGSFAGAIGIPQFMPTSYREYAVDFNRNGRRDLVNESEDAIGSVGNYLKRHGWSGGQAIFTPLTGPLSAAAAALVSKRAKPTLTAAQLAESGVTVDTTGAGASAKMALLRLREEQGYRHFIGFGNFYAITRYNPSVNYAMAVVELSRRISRERRR